MTNISTSLVLPNGTSIKNRLGKSAMSEALGGRDGRDTDGLTTLYQRWAQGGTGLVITGNVMIDHNHLGEPGNTIIEDESNLDNLKQWAYASKENGATAWMQINHPGKQSPNYLNKVPVSPSAIPLGKGLDKMFNKPRALAEDEILALIERYSTTASIAEKAGFDGVQIHGAHGYLVSQFLSPLHNQRTDRWGGSLENRMRFAIEVFRGMRKTTGSDFSVGIKMNSADFQRGGFTFEESMEVAQTLSQEGIDLIEISGGSYEQPSMTGVTKDSTKAREAYFLEYAEAMRQRIEAPLMVTGGFRTTQGIQDALASGALDIVGLARPLAVDPDFSNKLLSGDTVTSDIKAIKTGISPIDKMGIMEIFWYTHQLHRMAKGLKPNDPNVFWLFVRNNIKARMEGRKISKLRA